MTLSTGRLLMNLFDQLVTTAIEQNNSLTPLRMVVEKELLHHDIIREMSRAGLLEHLTFMGGTCLRACYGSNRLSEDLDFTGGEHFDKFSLENLATILTSQLHNKYGLSVEVTEPTRESGNVDTWKFKIITCPEDRSMPTQRINIDICSIPSYDRKPAVLRNHYGVNMGTENLILQVESREEIFADKVVAFALRPNRIKSRDLWDIAWLIQQNIILPVELVWRKVNDHQQEKANFLQQLEARQQALNNDMTLENDFQQEMCRFLPANLTRQSIEANGFWHYIQQIVNDVCSTLKKPKTSKNMPYTL